MLFPNLILAFRDYITGCDQLTLIEFDPRSQQYVEMGKIDLAVPNDSTGIQIVGVVRTQQYIFVAIHVFVGIEPPRVNYKSEGTNSYLIKFNLEFTEIKRIAFKSLATLETDGENLFISANGDFIYLSLDLEILDRAELTCWGGKKNAHDIFVHQGIAYLLDNVEIPVFVFKFDCSDPNNIKLLERHEISAAQPHLDAQWVDVDNQRWYILADQGGRFNYGQHLYVTEASSPLNQVKFKGDNVEPWGYLSGRLDIKILASSAIVPPWIVVREGKSGRHNIPEKLYLAKVICDRNSVRIEPCLDLYPSLLEVESDELQVCYDHCNNVFIEEYGSYLILESPAAWNHELYDHRHKNIVIQEYGNYLFLISSRTNKLILEDIQETYHKFDHATFEEAVILVIDIQEQPKIIFKKYFELDDHQVISKFALSPIL